MVSDLSALQVSVMKHELASQFCQGIWSRVPRWKGLNKTGGTNVVGDVEDVSE